MSGPSGAIGRARQMAGLAIAILALGAAFALYFIANPSSPYKGLVISEVMTSNGGTFADEDGDFRDWVELQNRGSSDISLLGVSLERDGDVGWRLPPVTLAPSETLLVWASGKDRAENTSSLHTSFRLSRDGVFLSLRSEDGTIIHSIDVPALARDTSFGAHPVFSDVKCYFPEPTPNRTNSSMCIEEALTR